MVSAGVVLHCDEVASAGRDGLSVRVLGRLVTFDPHASQAVIEHRDATLAVDTSLLEARAYHAGDLLQFIGELAPSGGTGELGLRARIVQSVAGLNISTYERAVDSLREFEASLSHPT